MERSFREGKGKRQGNRYIIKIKILMKIKILNFFKSLFKKESKNTQKENVVLEEKAQEVNTEISIEEPLVIETKDEKEVIIETVKSEDFLEIVKEIEETKVVKAIKKEKKQKNTESSKETKPAKKNSSKKKNDKKAE
jgi:hypothetical protein